jgi:DNA polymerase III sliding clamp (beta) subunit (PCNA family)
MEYLETIPVNLREIQDPSIKTFVATWGNYAFAERIFNNGEFPTYDRVIPFKQPTGKFFVDAKELLTIFARLPKGRTRFNGVLMKFAETGCTVSQDDIDTGITFSQTLPVVTEVFAPLTVRLNAPFLIDVLKVVEREIAFCFTDEPGGDCITNPVKILDADNENRVFVIMPIRS